MKNKDLYQLYIKFEKDHKTLESKMSLIEKELLKELLNLLNKECCDLIGSYCKGTFTFYNICRSQGRPTPGDIWGGRDLLKISYLNGFFRITYLDETLYESFENFEKIVDNWCNSIVGSDFESTIL